MSFGRILLFQDFIPVFVSTFVLASDHFLHTERRFVVFLWSFFLGLFVVILVVVFVGHFVTRYDKSSILPSIAQY